MKIGISTACLYPMETERSLETLSSMGFEVYEVFLNTFRELKPDFLNGLKKIAGQGRIVSVHPFTSAFESLLFFSDYIRRFEDGLSAYRYFLEAAVTLGARLFVLHGQRDYAYSAITEEDYFERYAALYRLGKTYGVTVAQENVNRFRSERPSFVKRMRRYLSEECAFVLDVKQAVRAGEDPYEMLTAMGERLVHVHINDNLPGRDCLLPGEGQMDYRRMRELLDRYTYCGDIVLEVYRRDFDTLS